MDTAKEIASIKLGNSIHKIVRLAFITYNKQSAFYRKCNSLSAHAERLVNHFYRGFLIETKAELKTSYSKCEADIFGLEFTPRKAVLQMA